MCEKNFVLISDKKFCSRHFAIERIEVVLRLIASLCILIFESMHALSNPWSYPFDMKLPDKTIKVKIIKVKGGGGYG